MIRLIRLRLGVCIFLALFPILAKGQTVPAFPGAEGFGAVSVGGRGGRIYEVTNLNDSGAGSLRAALTASGPRIVVFRTGGTIALATDLEVTYPYLTIAGQTAPGGGIAVKGATLRLETHDVIIRGLRLRVGDAASGPDPDNRDSLGIETNCRDCLNHTYNIVIDHCSISWATDENAQLWWPEHDVTIQWSIMSEGLRNSLHTGGEHSCGLIIGPGARRVSVHHNLFAHNYERNPVVQGNQSVHDDGNGIFADTTPATTEVINNTTYNWFWHATYLTDTGGLRVNLLGNYYKPGPNTSTNKGISIGSVDDALIFVSGNVGPGRPSDTGNDWLAVNGSTAYRSVAPAFPLSGVTTQSAMAAYDLVVGNAGAISPQRDAVDTRIISEVKSGTGSFQDCVMNCNSGDIRVPEGGWPALAAGTPPKDSDHDGMPDDWEIAHGFDPNNSADGSQITSSGYTNVEVYLNSLIPMANTTLTAPTNLHITSAQ